MDEEEEGVNSGRGGGAKSRTNAYYTDIHSHVPVYVSLHMPADAKESADQLKVVPRAWSRVATAPTLLPL